MRIPYPLLAVTSLVAGANAGITKNFNAEDEVEFLSNNASISILYKLFWTLWALATLFHMSTNRVFTDGMHYVLLSFAAVVLILKPASTFRLLLFLSLQLYESARTFQVISNHWIFTTLVNLTILHALAYFVLQRRSFRINRVEFFKVFAPLVRIELIILYFYVVLHKLNTGFFSLAGSCATDFFVAQNAYSLVPNNATMLLLSAYGTVFIEALIPLLLCFRRTRNYGILLGLCFHFVIAYNPLNGFYDFSSMLFAAYVLFASDKFSLQLHRLSKKIEHLRAGVKNYFHQFDVMKLGAALVVFLIGVLVMDYLAKQFDDFFRHICWTIYGTAYIVVFALAIFKRGGEAGRQQGFFHVKTAFLLLFPILVFVNGMSPYLGLKTESSFAMFSNLRTEGGKSNHLFIPASFQVFDFQKDVVEIISSTDEKLSVFAQTNRMFVYEGFKEYITRNNPERVEYLLNGKKHTYDAALGASDNALVQDRPFIFKKILRFRTFHKFDPQPCMH